MTEYFHAFRPYYGSVGLTVISVARCYCACPLGCHLRQVPNSAAIQNLYFIIFFFYFCVSMHRSISQIKHHLDATLCRFYFCRVTLHVSGASVCHQEYLKLVWRPLVRVLSLQVSHHILSGPNKEM